MITINHTRLRMSGALNIEHLSALKLHIGVNAHGWATVEGEAGENALEQLSGALAGREAYPYLGRIRRGKVPVCRRDS